MIAVALTGGPTHWHGYGVAPGGLALQAPAPPRPLAAVTRHRGVFQGQQIEYVATVEETPVGVNGAAPAATIVESAPDVAFHWSPFDPESPRAISYTPGKDAGTFLRLGTVATSVAAALSVSLPYIQRLGVERIQQHRIPLVKRLQAEMPRLGFTPQTPAESTSPIVTFAHKDLDGITKKLAAAKVDVRVAPYWIRIAASVYNDMADIERLLEALS